MNRSAVIEIPLTRGYVAIVDDNCPPEILAKRWHVRVGHTGKVYATRNIQTENGRNASEQLHRVLMKAPAGLQVDHIDGNGLNNRLSNLRVCTHSENQRNRGPNRNNAAGLKGVRFYRGRWWARIRVSNNELHLGVFDSRFEAAKAYDEAAVRLHGEFARTNASLGLLEGEGGLK